MPGRVQGCSSSPIPVTAPGPATRQEKKQNSSPKLCCAQHLPHDDVLLHPQEREGKGSDRGTGGREKRLMQIKRQLLQPSCKLGANCTHLQPPLPAGFCVGEAALRRALPAQPRERGVCSFPGQDGGVTTAAPAKLQQHQREQQEGKTTLNPLLSQSKKDPNKPH